MHEHRSVLGGGHGRLAELPWGDHGADPHPSQAVRLEFVVDARLACHRPRLGLPVFDRRSQARQVLNVVSVLVSEHVGDGHRRQGPGGTRQIGDVLKRQVDRVVQEAVVRRPVVEVQQREAGQRGGIAEQVQRRRTVGAPHRGEGPAPVGVEPSRHERGEGRRRCPGIGGAG